MIWSLLTLLTLAAMVFTMRPIPGESRQRGSSSARPSRSAASDGGQRGPAATGMRRARSRPNQEDKVSYRLMDEHLPSRSQRMWRSMVRFVKGAPRMERRASSDSDPARTGRAGAGPQQSAELQNFLDARRRDLTRRNASDTKRGPDETLH